MREGELQTQGVVSFDSKVNANFKRAFSSAAAS